MDSRALGLLETYGLVAAIEGADAALKTAAIELAGLERIGSGLVTITFRGDVSSVQVAMDAALAAAGRVGVVRHHRVIARLGQGVAALLPKAAANEATRGPGEAGPREQATKGQATDLSTMRVAQLRRLARSLKGFPMTREMIKFARKEELIARIDEFTQRQQTE